MQLGPLQGGPVPHRASRALAMSAIVLEASTGAPLIFRKTAAEEGADYINEPTASIVSRYPSISDGGASGVKNAKTNPP
jgi:hypothetical protein